MTNPIVRAGDRIRATRGTAVFEFEVARIDPDNEIMIADEDGDPQSTGVYRSRGWQVKVLARPLPTTPGSVIASRDPLMYAVLSLRGWRDENGRDIGEPNPEEVDVIFDRGDSEA